MICLKWSIPEKIQTAPLLRIYRFFSEIGQCCLSVAKNVINIIFELFNQGRPFLRHALLNNGLDKFFLEYGKVLYLQHYSKQRII